MQEDAKTSEGRKGFLFNIRFWVRLLEYSVVLFLVSVLVLLLLPVSVSKPRAKRATAAVEISQIQNAIQAYEDTYGQLPISLEPSPNKRVDFTFGTVGTGSSRLVQNPGGGRQANNSEVMAILMDLPTFRNGQVTVNTNSSLNAKRIVFLDAKLVQGGQGHGMGEDGVYRDPWGNPYIITIDLSGDGFCDDPLYGKVPRKVLVWSFGPDGKADLSLKPEEGVNPDNVTIAP